MIINRIDHIAVNVLNIEESVRFYKEIFGFREIKRVDMGELTLVYLEICKGSYLELFDLRGKCEKGDFSENLQGIRHFSIDVDDINAWNEHLKEKNADIVMGLTRMEQLKKDGILVRDPNGTIIELNADY